MENISNPLLSCYGIYNTVDLSYISIQKEEGMPTALEISELISHVDKRSIILFFTLQINGMQEQVMSVESLIERRYGLRSKLLAVEKQYSFWKKINLCAVAVELEQFQPLLNVLISLPNHAFAVISDSTEIDKLVKNLFPCFETGLLVPSVLVRCCNLALENQSSFLHVLDANDGYAINLFARN